MCAYVCERKKERERRYNTEYRKTKEEKPVLGRNHEIKKVLREILGIWRRQRIEYEFRKLLKDVQVLIIGYASKR